MATQAQPVKPASSSQVKVDKAEDADKKVSSVALGQIQLLKDFGYIALYIGVVFVVLTVVGIPGASAGMWAFAIGGVLLATAHFKNKNLENSIPQQNTTPQAPDQESHKSKSKRKK